MEMKLMLYCTVVFHVVIFHVEDVLTSEQKVVPKLEAGQECSRRGGSLVNYKEIQNKTAAPQYLDELENGATAWIDGYAEFSPFLYWLGCYSITDVRTVNTFEMEDRSLFLCSKECFHHGYFHHGYVGVKNTTCFCVRPYYFYHHLSDINTVSPSLCYISCSNNGIDSCGGDLHMDLYGIQRYISWGPKEPVNRQCVYYFQTTVAFERYTASCHTLHRDGFVCQEVKGSVFLTATCTNTFINWDTRYCFKAETSTRQEAYKRCLDINGRLTTDTLFTENAVLYNSMYWTSTFRSFGLSDNRTSNAVCIAATKVNNIIYFEPDDCSVKKYFMCKYNELTASASVTHQQTRLGMGRVPSQAPGITDSKQNSNSQAARIATSKQDSNINMDPIIGYISLAVSVVALAVAAVVIFLLYKFKMWIMGAVLPPDNSGHRGEGFYPHPVQRNDENYSQVSSSRHYAVSDCENRSPDTQSRHLTEHPGSQRPLAVSSPVKEDLDTVELPHIYEGLSEDRQHATYEVISQ